MRTLMAYNKKTNSWGLMLHDPDIDVQVFVDITEEKAQKLKLILTDIKEDKRFIYYRENLS